MNALFSMDWEVEFILFLQSFRSPFLDTIVKGITMLGDQYALILLVGLCYWCIDKRLGRSISLAFTGSIISGSLIQGFVMRKRPYMEHPEIECIRPAYPDEDPMSITAQGSSFPSLHSALSVSGYGTLALVTKKRFTQMIGFVLPLLIGFSRLYLGVHYPTDVLAGWLLGAVMMIVFYYLGRRFGYKAGFAVQLVLGALGFFYCRDNSFFSIYGIIIGLFSGFWYEEKKVHFEMPLHWRSYILRPLFGLIVFGIFSVLLKLPVMNVSSETSGVLLSIYRVVRYGISSFVTIGIYPYLFSRIKFL